MSDQHTIQSLREAIRKLESRPPVFWGKNVVSFPSGKLANWFPSGGFPRGSCTEIRTQEGMGGTSLVGPAFAKESHENWVAVVDFDGRWNAPGFAHWDVNWGNVCVILAEKSRKGLWALHQVVKSGLFSLVTVWGQVPSLSSQKGRLLHQAAESGQVAVVFVGGGQAVVSCPCVMRLGLEGGGQGRRVLSALKGGERAGASLEIFPEELWGSNNAFCASSFQLSGFRRLLVRNPVLRIEK